MFSDYVLLHEPHALSLHTALRLSGASHAGLADSPFCIFSDCVSREGNQIICALNLRVCR
jgi:hypothetical protein